MTRRHAARLAALEARAAGLSDLAAAVHGDAGAVLRAVALRYTLAAGWAEQDAQSGAPGAYRAAMAGHARVWRTLAERLVALAPQYEAGRAA
jgi:hypothetical protein